MKKFSMFIAASLLIVSCAGDKATEVTTGDAQEVNEVAPELVTYAEDVDKYGVKYGNTTALLVEAVKELTQQVKDLKQEIEEMKNVK